MGGKPANTALCYERLDHRLQQEDRYLAQTNHVYAANITKEHKNQHVSILWQRNLILFFHNLAWG